MLKENHYCPVCNTNLWLKKNVAKIEIRKKIDPSSQAIVLENYVVKNKTTIIVIKLIMILFGLILLALAGLFLSGLGDPEIIWYKKIGLVIAILPLIASSIVFFSIAYEKIIWERLVLKEKTIIIQFSKDRKIIEIPSECLLGIKIGIQNSPVEKRTDGTNMVTKIKLIIDTVNQNYNIGTIKSFSDEFEALDYCKELHDYFKKNYAINSEMIELQSKKNAKFITILLLSLFIFLPLIGIILLKI
jgi:hypothetical protein